MNTPVSERDLSSELIFRTSRSSGSGGQNVNKVSTKVELVFYLDASAEFNEEEKALLRVRLRSRISKDGAIHLFCQTGRSQILNKKRVIERFYKIMDSALKPRKVRIPTSISPEVEELRKRNKIQKCVEKGNKKKA
jgi:ribosome-associated protein